jgi:DNA polymerase-3 subunit delta
MTGGRRVVRIRGAGNAHAPVFESLLSGSVSDALVVVEGGDLAKNSSLREIFEEASNAVAIPCYLDSSETIADLLRTSLKAQAIAIAPDVLDEAVSLLGADRGTTRREVEKLILYAHGRPRVTLEDIRAIMGDEAEARIEEVCDAAGEGDASRLDLVLERLWSAGVTPIAILRVALGHFQRLALAKSQMDKAPKPLPAAPDRRCTSRGSLPSGRSCETGASSAWERFSISSWKPKLFARQPRCRPKRRAADRCSPSPHGRG